MAMKPEVGLETEADRLCGIRPVAAISKPRVSIVMPCLNEIAGVAAAVREARGALERAGLPADVIVVDNGSRDGSPFAAARAGAVVVVERRRGYGAAIQKGLRVAGGDVVVVADADGSYDFHDLEQLLGWVHAGADLVVGVRLGGTLEPGAMPWHHRWIGTPLLNLLIARLTGRRFRDSQSGFRAMRREQALALALDGDGMELATEMLVRAHRAGLRIEEAPIRYRRRLGRSKLRPINDGLRHGALLLQFVREGHYSTRKTM